MNEKQLRFSFSVLVFAYQYVYATKRQEVEKHLDQGKLLLAQGQFADALHQYQMAVELDPTDYQIYYRRATVLLAMGRVKAALPDLDKVVELKPDFIAGRVQRGNILLKQGQLDQAADDFKTALKTGPNSEASDKLQTIAVLREWIETAVDYFENNDYGNAEELLNKAIEHCQWDPDLLRKRAKCRQARGDIQNAIADIRAISKLVPDATDTYLEISRMYYDVGDVENSLTQIRECLKLNPDHKECFPFYKRVKKLAKMRDDLEKAVKGEKWMECLEKGKAILKFEPHVDNVQFDVFRHTCKCNAQAGHIAESIQECTEVLNYVDENDLDILCERGEAYILNEQFEKAVEDFQKALNAHEGSRKAKEGLERAQRLLKQSKKKDYYKILGVKRNANKREVEKAYRKLAQKWHPDNFQEEEEKKHAQEKFIDIANAKDVLTDPEKRKQFDMGQDPLDPEAAQHGHHGWHHGGGHPFGQGFGGGGFPFGGEEGGPFSFKFHF